jgi:molybdate transport system ATP-binding protein
MTLTISLQHRFDGFALDVEFHAPGGVTALFGRSGSGKTTVINAVAGLLAPQKGRVTVNDVVLFDSERSINLPPHRRRVGYVFQDARLFPHLTVHQNLRYGRWFAANKSSVSFDHIVALLGIDPLLQRHPGALSGGEKQRVAIGRAILSNPSLLALDEPLAALDDARKAEILPYLEKMRDELNLPILYVSHSMAEVARLANTVIVLDAGRVIAAGPTAEILSDPTIAMGLGSREAGAVILAKVAAQDDDGLTRLDCAGGALWVPRVASPIGATLRIRILAQDVMLAATRPMDISALNVLPAIVRDVGPGDGPTALVRLNIGSDAILVSVTRRSANALALVPGKPVFAILKSVSIAQENIGARGAAH